MVQYGERLYNGVEFPRGVLANGITLGPGVRPIADRMASATPTTTVEVSYDEAATLTYVVSLHNTGPLGVTVVGVELPPHRHQLLAPAAVRLGRKLPDGGSSILDTEPLAPFTLRGGARRSLVAHMRFGDCEWYAAGGGQTLIGWRIRYRVLGLTKTAEVPLPVQLWVESPAHCPRQGPARTPQAHPTQADLPQPPTPVTTHPR